VHPVVNPSHVSAGSQTPVLARQTTPLATTASVGQVALVPVQVSARSHGPAEGRQVNVFAR